MLLNGKYKNIFFGKVYKLSFQNNFSSNYNFRNFNMTNNYSHQCAECSSEGATCVDYGFTARVQAYQTQVLIPALINLRDSHLLPSHLRFKESELSSD
jgi:hypothetical protein